MVRRPRCRRGILRKGDVGLLAELGDGQDMDTKKHVFMEEDSLVGRIL